jgi:hypothetical protein
MGEEGDLRGCERGRDLAAPATFDGAAGECSIDASDEQRDPQHDDEVEDVSGVVRKAQSRALDQGSEQ